MSLPQWPNPTAKDEKGTPIYQTHESLMIAYQKAYGMAEAVRLINQYMNQQEQTITNLITRNEQLQSGE